MNERRGTPDLDQEWNDVAESFDVGLQRRSHIVRFERARAR
jgi:hypothetical protein